MRYRPTLVDPQRLDSYREVIDQRVFELMTCETLDRSTARRKIATELGGVLWSRTSGKYEWWGAVVVPTHFDPVRNESRDQHMLAAMRLILSECSERICQAAVKEDAETAALLRQLDQNVDIGFDEFQLQRCYPDDPRHCLAVWFVEPLSEHYLKRAKELGVIPRNTESESYED